MATIGVMALAPPLGARLTRERRRGRGARATCEVAGDGGAGSCSALARPADGPRADRPRLRGARSAARTSTPCTSTRASGTPIAVRIVGEVSVVLGLVRVAEHPGRAGAARSSGSRRRRARPAHVGPGRCSSPARRSPRSCGVRRARRAVHRPVVRAARARRDRPRAARAWRRIGSPARGAQLPRRHAARRPRARCSTRSAVASSPRGSARRDAGAAGLAGLQQPLAQLALLLGRRVPRAASGSVVERVSPKSLRNSGVVRYSTAPNCERPDSSISPRSSSVRRRGVGARRRGCA